MMTKIDCSQIEEGVRFTKPVFFDDMQNMFLCANRPAKKYHVVALKRWEIPYLYTEGKRLAPSKYAPVAAAPVYTKVPEPVVLPSDDQNLDELEEVDELEELEEI